MLSKMASIVFKLFALNMLYCFAHMTSWEKLDAEVDWKCYVSNREC